MWGGKISFHKYFSIDQKLMKYDALNFLVH